MERIVTFCDNCGKEIFEMQKCNPRGPFVAVGKDFYEIEPCENGLPGDKMIKVLILGDICKKCYRDAILKEAARIQEEKC